MTKKKKKRKANEHKTNERKANGHPRSARKPYSHLQGYKSSLVCHIDGIGGHVVIYDRQNGFEIDADERYIVMHEPSGGHVAVSSMPKAYEIQKGVANAPTRAKAQVFADILPKGK